MNYEEIRNNIVKGLHESLQCNIVPTDTTDDRPEYPYISYKFTSLYIPQGSHNLINNIVLSNNENFEYDIETTREEQPKMVISISSYSNDEIEAYSLALRASQWFKFHGYQFLKDNGIIVVSTSNVQDRTILIVDDYEKRQGFDATIRVCSIEKTIVETMEHISIDRRD